MRVLHLSSEKTWRGGEQQIAYLIDELQKRNIYNFVAARNNSVFEDHCQKNNIPYATLPFKNSFDIKTALGIKKLCSQHQIDLVHMHSAKSHAVGVVSAALGNKTPLILSRRVDFVPKNNFLTKWKYNHSSIKRIVGVSGKITEIMSAYVNKPEKCVTVHSGIDLGKFSERPAHNILRDEFKLSNETILIGNTSALENHKDYPTFIRTVASIYKQGIPVHAFIIGQGSLKEQLSQQIRESGAEEIFHLTGFRKDIQKVLPSLDVFLITSNEEGLGTSVLDAFAAQVPVVATNAGGIPEMVEDNVTGLLRPVGDVEALAQAVTSLIENKNLQRQLINGATEKLKEFSKEQTAEKTLTIYKQVLASLKQ